ncbi:hypothetical protein [Sulfobacillus thermosulfidooxidans]|uniref:hypothetical protein n=1 Tax=Sulfobacillus thermosulfidooxidans TaxID=28034 RepID=UPI0006B6984E|nr:hypothetical protein [Sulfobacillus thermosulfidooxidans]
MRVAAADTISGNLITDFFEIGQILEALGRSDLTGEASGLIVTVNERAGEYEAVWMTTASRPYETTCRYRCIWDHGQMVG